MEFKLNPLTASDLKVGSTYLRVSTYMDGTLALERFTMLSQPDQDGMFASFVTYDGGSYETDQYLESIGCPQKPRTYQDNYHRTFADEPDTAAVLEDLVAKQALSTWLRLIGVKDEVEELRRIQLDAEQFKRTVDLSDSIASSDPLTALDLLGDILHSKRASR